MPPSLVWTRRILQLVVGQSAYGLGAALLIRADIGLDPWDVLTQGLSERIGLSFGTLTILIGALVLLAWIPLRQRPGFGTVLNVVLVGPAIDVGLAWFPAASGLWAQGLEFALGLLVLAVASGLYIGARLGPGPRDGLMTGLHSRLGWPIWLCRTLVEGTVLVAGWLLGGSVGVGTVAFAVLIGPMVGRTIPWLRVPETPRAVSGSTSGGPCPTGADATRA
ncbi:hypothetical protein [Frondihabitans peucedani]|jgi:uncharacterized membrane protein YczE|uniref:Membrane protein n=1 Tax=Frondihabitans peucedani TaxID=598626 RepID=A0ABP8E4S5_9MICO